MLSGSEFALRVAVCDLAQRLKRCEQMCQYLEACRNELAKECIKLRQENYCLSKQMYQYTNDRNITESTSKLNISPGGTPILKSRFGDYKEDKVESSTEVDLDGKKDEVVKDESWEEITARLIKEMKKEVIGAYLAQKDQQGDAQESSKSRPINEYLNQTFKEYQTKLQHIPIQDATNSDLKEFEIDEEKCVTQNNPFLSTPVPKMKNVIKVEGASRASNFTDVLKVPDKHIKQEKHGTPDVSEIVFGEDEENQPMTDFCAEILRSVNLNTDQLTRIISQQNDRLTRLKSKQLRNYFRRQLDYTAQSSREMAGKPTLEHV